LGDHKDIWPPRTTCATHPQKFYCRRKKSEGTDTPHGKQLIKMEEVDTAFLITLATYAKWG